MRFLEWAPDGGQHSGLKGFYIIEIKSLFSIVLLKFDPVFRETYHSHAFNALTFWISGAVQEQHLDGTILYFGGGQFKWTPRSCFHRVIPMVPTWALSFRGPWQDKWYEWRKDHKVTLTHGRREIS